MGSLVLLKGCDLGVFLLDLLLKLLYVHLLGLNHLDSFFLSFILHIKIKRGMSAFITTEIWRGRVQILHINSNLIILDTKHIDFENL